MHFKWQGLGFEDGGGLIDRLTLLLTMSNVIYLLYLILL